MGSRQSSKQQQPPGVPAEPEHASSSSAASIKAVTPAAEESSNNPTAALVDRQGQNSKDHNSNEGKDKDLASKSSWYGTWPSKKALKAAASTKVARDSILKYRPTTSMTSLSRSRVEPSRSSSSTSSVRSRTLRRPPSMLLGKSRETSDVSLNAHDFDPSSSTDTLKKDGKPESTSSTTASVHDAPAASPTDEADTTMHDPPVEATPSQTLVQPQGYSGWFGWLGQSAPIKEEEAETSQQDKADDSPKASDGSSAQQPLSEPQDRPPAATSWFGFWPTQTASQSASNTDTVMKDGPTSDVVPVKDDQDSTKATPTDPATTISPPAKANQPAPGSSWAFWYRDTSKTAQTIEESGQLAIKGDASQNRPEPARASLSEDAKTFNTMKRNGTEAGLDETSPQKAAQKVSESPKKKTTKATSATSLKSSPPNLLLPSFRSTYQPVENPSMMQQVSRMLLRSKQPVPKQCSILRTAPKIKKAVAIGIHGLFPAAFLRTVIGQPTGTSVRFSNHAAAAIKRWAASHGRGFQDIEIEKIALEGEGKIGERVDNLWNLLMNWKELLEQAEFIFVACHSQGVPVGIILVAKLIEAGIVKNAHIGVCAMAGVSLGPFTDYKSRFLGGSAAELFDFANLESTVSKRYIEALKVAVKYGARITYCGSIDDQLVSLESSTFSCVSHPYIFRTVFIDGRIHAPDFMAHLVGFALKLRNLGVSDHGLIRELSVPLAGSLYGGEGHSRLYDDPQVYDLVVEHTLSTTSVGDEPLRVQNYEAPINQNPYLLPWAIRGLLEEDIVKTELNQETKVLLEQFDEWKPTTKALKDVKFRLEAVKSKL